MSSLEACYKSIQPSTSIQVNLQDKTKIVITRSKQLELSWQRGIAVAFMVDRLHLGASLPQRMSKAARDHDSNNFRMDLFLSLWKLQDTTRFTRRSELLVLLTCSTCRTIPSSTLDPIDESKLLSLDGKSLQVVQPAQMAGKLPKLTAANLWSDD